MKNLLFALAALTSVAAFADPNPYADYGAAMKSDEKNMSAVDWSKKNDAKLAEATSDEALAAVVADEASAKKLLAAIKPAYETCPIAAAKIAAVSQWVMLPDPWYCLFWDGEHEAGRKVWTAALLDTMKDELFINSIDDVKEIDEVGSVRYYVCAIGYDKFEHVTDHEVDLGDFDTEEEARACFEDACKKTFQEIDDIEELKYWKIQLEVCDDTFNGVECFDILEEYNVNPIALFFLTNEEANAIDHLTSLTRMDCWFWLCESIPGEYCVRDLEHGENMQLDEALGQALDGFGSKENLISLGATEREVKVLTRVLINIGVIDE